MTDLLESCGLSLPMLAAQSTGSFEKVVAPPPEGGRKTSVNYIQNFSNLPVAVPELMWQSPANGVLNSLPSTYLPPFKERQNS